jgi:hypothetical protein
MPAVTVVFRGDAKFTVTTSDVRLIDEITTGSEPKIAGPETVAAVEAALKPP